MMVTLMQQVAVANQQAHDGVYVIILDDDDDDDFTTAGIG